MTANDRKKTKKKREKNANKSNFDEITQNWENGIMVKSAGGGMEERANILYVYTVQYS